MRDFLNTSSGNRGQRFHRDVRLIFTAWLAAGAPVIGATEITADDQHPIIARDLVNIRDIGGHSFTAVDVFGALSVSPNGDYIAFQLQTPNLETRSYDLSWRIMETEPGGKTWEASDGGEVILNQYAAPAPRGSRYPVKAQWSPDSQWIYYLKRIDGNTQIWGSRISDYGDEQLTHNAGQILSFRLSGGGEKIFFTAANPKDDVSKELPEEGDRGFLYDDRFHPQRSKTPYGRDCGFRVSGSMREVGINRACKPPLWVFDIPPQIESEATAEEAEAYRRQSTITPLLLTESDRILLDAREDGSAISMENENPNKFPGFSPPMRLHVSLDDNDFRCNANECYGYKGMIEGASWRPGRNEIVFQRADGPSMSMSGLYSWRPGADQVRSIIRTEDQLGDCKILASRAICLREQWTRPRTIVSVNLDSGEIETMYDPNPEFDDIVFSKIEKIEWEDTFGNPTHGHLVYPLNYEPGRRYPLVITTYRSRGFLRGAVGDEYPIHVLAANGFMVLSHDMPKALRRKAVYRPVLNQFEDNYERRSTLSAQETILDTLIRRGLVDPDRVAITGLSNGAVQVQYALIHTNHFSAAIASSAFDWSSSYWPRPDWQRAFRRQVMGGTPDDDKNGLYKTLSLGLNAEKVNAPLLINVSDHELLGSVEPLARLEDADKPVEMYVFPGEYHIKWQPQHRLAIYRRNVQWLKFWLMGKEEDDPVSPGQYVRWRKMRDAQCTRLNGADMPWYCSNGEVNLAAQ